VDSVDYSPRSTVLLKDETTSPLCQSNTCPYLATLQHLHTLPSAAAQSTTRANTPQRASAQDVGFAQEPTPAEPAPDARAPLQVGGGSAARAADAEAQPAAARPEAKAVEAPLKAHARGNSAEIAKVAVEVGKAKTRREQAGGNNVEEQPAAKKQKQNPMRFLCKFQVVCLAVRHTAF